jgi:hypothetical protein
MLNIWQVSEFRIPVRRSSGTSTMPSVALSLVASGALSGTSSRKGRCWMAELVWCEKHKGKHMESAECVWPCFVGVDAGYPSMSAVETLDPREAVYVNDEDDSGDAGRVFDLGSGVWS